MKKHVQEDRLRDAEKRTKKRDTLPRAVYTLHGMKVRSVIKEDKEEDCFRYIQERIGAF